ncbi:MAG TPA: glycosyltransferase [Stellaceae bacterium]|jgi:glycosyltransferase involved in cell wall biosynthesis
MKICIVSPDIVGPILNGGVGTASTALAQALTEEGHTVDLFYTSTYFETGDLAGWREHYAALGIGFLGLDENTRPPVHRTPTVYGEDAVAQSYHVYQALKGSDYDVIQFVDYLGLGYFTALAKHQGLCLSATTLVVTAHSPTLWSRLTNGAVIDDVTYLMRDRMERRLVEYADVLVSPSRYMLGWMEREGWTLPARQEVIPNLLPTRGPPAAIRPPAPVQELVFFGRLEPRKGLLVFCDAIDRIDAPLDPSVPVTFLGKAGEDYPLATLRARAARWRRKVTFLTDRDTFGALEYLREPGRLAVLAAIRDNSPYTVLESLFNGIPFISTTVGGVPELVAESEQARVLVEPTPGGLGRGILEACTAEAFPPAAAAFTLEAVRERHVALYAGLRPAAHPAKLAVPATAGAGPLVTVNLLHRERPRELMRALGSIEAQTYDSIEIVVVDNGSTSAAATEYLHNLEAAPRRFPTRVVRMAENCYEPTARNKGAELAAGRHILFMDDDNVAKPHEVSTFCAAAARTEFDVLTCFSDYFLTEEPPASEADALRRFVVLGDFGVLGLLLNGYGDLNCFVRRDRFLEVGGFVVDGCFNHAEDWRFFAKAQARGFKIGVVPEALFWYRTESEGYGRGWRRRDRGGALERAAAAVGLDGAGGTEPLLRLAQGLFWRSIETEAARRSERAELKEAQGQTERLLELVEQLTATNAALRRDLLTVIDFTERSTDPQTPVSSEAVRRGLDSLALFAARRL